MTTERHNLRRWGVLTALTLAMVGLTGCVAGSWLLQGLFPEQVKAQYELTDRKTLVRVDDTDNQLGDPALPNKIAAKIAFDLVEEKQLTRTNVVSLRKLNSLSLKLGKDFNKIAVDRIGRELGAHQVIHVIVEEASIRPNFGMLEPQAVVFVKVVDAVESKRLFPQVLTSDAAPGSPLTEKGGQLAPSLRPRPVTVMDENAAAELQIQLADRIARDVGRVFYTWTVEDPQGALRD